MFFRLFEPGFRATTSKFWELYWLFCFLDVPYQNTGENVSSPALKLVLWHSPLIFENFGGNFALFGRIVAKTRAEKFICWLWNQFFSIRRSFLSTLVAILHQSNVPLQSYRQIRFVTGFEIGFTAFAALIWALWCKFFVNRTYCCQDTCLNISLWALKPVSWHSPHFLMTGGYFVSIGSTVAKTRAKMILCSHWNLFYCILHSFLSAHFGGYFASIGRAFGMIRAEMFLRWLWNWF